MSIAPTVDASEPKERRFCSASSMAVFGFDPEQARAALAFSMDADAGGGVAGGGTDMLLPLFVGDVVTLLQECEDGWYLGHSINNPGHKGVFPRDAI